MAVYKIFPLQDTTLYSSYPSMNTGLDAMCEVSNILNLDGLPSISRYIIQFDNNEIKDILNKIGDNQYDVFLRNFIATAQGINLNVSLEVRPLAQQWNNGTGYYLNHPETQDGASWRFPLYSGSIDWDISGSYNGFPFTSSYNSTYSGPGGGNWFYDDNNLFYVEYIYSDPSYIEGSSMGIPKTQSFELRSNKDLSVSVKPIVDVWYSDTIPNNGFLIKFPEEFEFNPSKYVQPILKYYSVDTNTIYPPQLEFKWRDYTSVIDENSPIVNTTDLKMSLAENPGVFDPSSINRFYINVSPLYPTRVYQTSSLYTNLNYLPTSSYYAVKDLDTNEFVINFDEQYTQISSDENGNYFDLYMSGLEPERYYKIIIKTIINNSTLIFDDNYYFKVIN